MRAAPPLADVAPLLLLATLLAACGGSDRGERSDTGFASDLALAGADSAAQPALRDAPAAPPVLAPDPGALTTPTPAPRTASPAARTTTPAAPAAPGPAAPAPAERTVSGNEVGTEGRAGGAVGTVAGGSVVRLSAGQRICTSTSRVGDRFTAAVTETVEGSNGARIPAGSTLILEATEMRRSENARERPVLGFAVVSIVIAGVTYPVVGEVTQVQVETARSDGGGNAMRKVATGAAIGAIVGQILGRDTRSTVTGAGAGAVAGGIAAVVTANFDGCVPGGGRLDVRITEPLQIKAE